MLFILRFFRIQLLIPAFVGTASLAAQSVTVDPDMPDGAWGSLREVIIRINNGDLAADTVLIPNGATVTLDAYSGGLFPTGAESDDIVFWLDSQLTIRTVDPYGEPAVIRTAENYRHFRIEGGDITLENLRFQEGYTRIDRGNPDQALGGAILAMPGTHLTVRRCVFSGNIAHGMNGQDDSKDAAALAGKPARGGAIYAEGPVVVEDSYFYGNRAVGGNGGKGHNEPTDPITGPFRAYTGGRGGDATGGAIHMENAPITLVRSTFGRFEPLVFFSGGNEAIPGKGGRGGNQGVWTLFLLTIRAGDGGDGGDGFGGAVFIRGSDGMDAENTTFANNRANRGEPGETGEHGSSPGESGHHGQAFGGGLELRGNEHSLIFCTVFANRAHGNGGVRQNSGGSNLHLHNTVIAGNIAPGHDAADLRVSSGSIAMMDYNFIEADHGFTVPDGAEGNILGESAHGLLEELRFYDGTHVPFVPRDPVVHLYGMGDPDADGYPATDARGLSRVYDGNADIGATEARTHTLAHGGTYTMSLGGELQPMPTFELFADGEGRSHEAFFEFTNVWDEFGYDPNAPFDPISWDIIEMLGYQNRETFPIRFRSRVSGVDKEAVTTVTIENTAPVWTDDTTYFLESMEKELDPPGLVMGDLLAHSAFHHTEPMSVAVRDVFGEHLQYRLTPDAEWQDMPDDIGPANALLLEPESRIRLRPPDEFFNGAFDNIIDLRLWETTQDFAPGDRVDMSETGGSTPFSGNSRGMSFIVYPVNDAPVVTDGGSLVWMPDIDEKSTGHENITIASRFEDRYFDHDGDPFSGVAVVGVASGGVGGDWLYRMPGDTEWRMIDAASDENALLLPPQAHIRFAHGGGTDYGQAPALSARLYDGSAWVPPAPDVVHIADLIGGEGSFSTGVLDLRQTVNGVIDDPPTDIHLSNATIPEGENGLPVGNLTTEDPDNDLGDTHTYSIASDPSGLFVIDGSQLRLHPELMADYEILDSHTVRIRTTDSVGLTFEKNFDIDITNRNDPPVFLPPALWFDGDSSVSLPDATVTNSYTLEAWIRLDEYRGWSRIIRFSNGQANDNLILGFESTGRHLMLETYHGGSGTRVVSDIEVPLDRWIHVAGVNHGAGSATASLYINGIRVGHAGGQNSAAQVNRTNNALASSTFNDPNFRGAIGQARLWDTWVDQPMVATLRDTPYFPHGTSNRRFQLFDETGDYEGTPNNNPLRIGIRDFVPLEEGPMPLTGLDFYDPEAAPGDTMRLVVTTSQGTIEAGSGGAINLSGNGSGELTAEGPRSHLQDLLTLGDLLIVPPPNTLPDATVTLLLNDLGHTGPGGEQTATATFTVSNTGLSLPPFDLRISNHSVEENDPGAVIGTLAVSDAQPDETHTFTLLENIGHAFEIADGNVLRLKDGIHLNYEETSQHTLLVRAENSAGLSIESEFTINVIDVNDRPMWTEDGFTVSLSPVTQDQTDPDWQSVADALESRYFDEDGDPFTHYAIVGNHATSTQGSWRIADGDTIIPFGVSEDNAWLVDKDLAIRFIPEPDFDGTPGHLVVRAWDGSSKSSPSPVNTSVSVTGNTGLTGAYSAETGNIAITVEPMTNAPVYQPLIGRGVIWEPNPENMADGWELGDRWFYDQPLGVAGDPFSGYIGNKVIGHERNFQIMSMTSQTTITPDIDTAGYEDLELEFKRWLVRSSSRTAARLGVSPSNAQASLIWSAGERETIRDTSWVPVKFPLPTAPSLSIFWTGYSTLDIVNDDGGWNLDAIRVTAANAALPVETADFMDALAGPDGIGVDWLLAHMGDSVIPDPDIAFGELGIAVAHASRAAGTWQYSNDDGGTWLDIPADVSKANSLLLGHTARVRLLNPGRHIIHDFFRAHFWDGRVGTSGSMMDLNNQTGGFGSFSVESFHLNYDATTGNVPLRDLRVSSSQVAYDWPGMTVGTVAATDVSRQSRTYALIEDPTGKFEIKGNDILRLRAGESLSVSDGGEITLLVRAENESGTTLEDQITLDVVPPSPPGPFVGFGHAVSFNGNYGHHLATDAGLPLQDTSFTFEFWMRNPVTGLESALLSQGVNEVNEHLHINLRSNGGIRFGFYGNDLDAPADSVQTQTWAHFAFTYDHATGQRRILRNGEIVAEDTASGAPQFPEDSPFLIGRYNDLNSSVSLDEIRVWNTARSPGQIAANFQRRVDPDSPELIALYDFEYFTSHHARDRAGSRDAHAVNGSDFVGLGNIPLRLDAAGTDPVSVPLTGFDPEGRALNFTIVDSSGDGEASIDGDTLVYQPSTHLTGPEATFHYAVTAGGDTSSAVATIVFALPHAHLELDDHTVAGGEAGAAVGALSFADGLTPSLVADASGIFTLDGGVLRIKNGFRADAAIFPEHMLTLHLTDDEGRVSAHNVTIQVGESTAPPVILPPAVALDGDSGVNLPGISHVTNSYMIEAWIKVEEYREWSRIIRFSNGQANDNLILGFGPSGSRLVLTTYNGSSATGVISDIEVPLNRWIHVAGVNYGSATGTAAIFINGIRVGFAGGQNNAAHVTRGNNAVGTSTWDNEPFRGLVGQARLWDSWVDQQTVLERMHTFHFESGPRFQWFDENGQFTGTPEGAPVHTGTFTRVPESAGDLPLENLILLDPDAANDDTFRVTANTDTGTLLAENATISVSGNDTATLTLEGEYAAIRDFLDAGGLAWRPDPATHLVADVSLTAENTTTGGPQGNGTLSIRNESYNLAPSGIELSAGSVADGQPGATVGTLTAIDPNPGDTHDFEIVSDPSGLFEIADGNVLRLRESLAADHALFESHTITLRATDPGGLSVETDAAIGVDPRNRAPVLIPPTRRFNGGNSVTLPTVEAIGGAYTIEAWIRRDANRQWARIAEFSNGATNDTLALALHDDSRRLMLETFADGVSQTRVVSDVIIPHQHWLHVAGVNHGDGTATLYFNGIRVGRATGQNVAAEVERSQNHIAGSEFGIPDWDGLIGQTRLWNRALTQTEITNAAHATFLAGDAEGPAFEWIQPGGTTLGTPAGNPPPHGARDFASTSRDPVPLDRLDFFDADSTPDDPVRLTASVGHGTLTADGDGLTVTDSGTGSIAVEGTGTDIRTFLLTGGLVYQIDGYAGVETTLALELDDLGHTGPGGPQTGTATLNITVDPPDIPVTVTAVDHTREAGAPEPEFATTVSGLPPDETFAGLFGGDPVVQTPATLQSAPGVYPLTVDLTGLAAPGFTLAAEHGLLTVTEPTVFANWSRFTTGELIDPAQPRYGETLPAIVTFATGADTGAYPFWLTTGGLDDPVDLYHHRRVPVEGVEFLLERSTDLETWEPIENAELISKELPVPGLERWHHRISRNADLFFYRLRILPLE
ncbi:MAG: hypothetical protein JJU00_01315 [Opitutales bacterium]|nr:hypothetical protein [Opitutales bacterium]